MMISGKQVQSVVQAYRLSNAAAEPPPSKAGSVTGKDRVTLSMEGQEARQLLDQVRSLLDVRPNRVGSLRKQVASGEYRVESGEIVDKLLARSLADRLS